MLATSVIIALGFAFFATSLIVSMVLLMGVQTNMTSASSTDVPEISPCSLAFLIISGFLETPTRLYSFPLSPFNIEPPIREALRNYIRRTNLFNREINEKRAEILENMLD